LLQLVERVNAPAVQASCDFDAWLGWEALQNGPIRHAQQLQLELAFHSRVEEVPNSDAGSDEDSSEDDAGMKA
jgi:hypothetical protein